MQIYKKDNLNLIFNKNRLNLNYSQISSLLHQKSHNYNKSADSLVGGLQSTVGKKIKFLALKLSTNCRLPTANCRL